MFNHAETTNHLSFMWNRDWKHCHIKASSEAYSQISYTGSKLLIKSSLTFRGSLVQIVQNYYKTKNSTQAFFTHTCAHIIIIFIFIFKSIGIWHSKLKCSEDGTWKPTIALPEGTKVTVANRLVKPSIKRRKEERKRGGRKGHALFGWMDVEWRGNKRLAFPTFPQTPYHSKVSRSWTDQMDCWYRPFFYQFNLQNSNLTVFIYKFTQRNKNFKRDPPECLPWHIFSIQALQALFCFIVHIEIMVLFKERQISLISVLRNKIKLEKLGVLNENPGLLLCIYLHEVLENVK